MATDPSLQYAMGLSPKAAALSGSPFEDLPNFVHDVVATKHPALSGRVVMRYPTMGDMIQIDALSAPGKPYTAISATFQVLVVAAPAGWWAKDPGDAEPHLATSRLPYDPALLDLYTAFLRWRDSFRWPSGGGAAAPADVGRVSALAGGPLPGAEPVQSGGPVPDAAPAAVGAISGG